jgi:putative GTP pyrophosphokinase
MSIMSLDRNWHRQECDKYKTEYPAYEKYASVLSSILTAVCRLHAPLAMVQARAKSLSSFAEKMARKADKYQPLGLWPTDLCGARVITETESEVERIRGLLTIDEANSQDVRSRLNDSEFGYRSVHYVVQLKSAAILGVAVPRDSAIAPRKFRCAL